MRVVLDSNILIAAFATRGLCHSLFELCLSGHTLYLSNDILDEVEEKLASKIKVPPKTVREIISFLRKSALMADPAILDPKMCRDPDDIKILGLTVACQAECLVSEDQDLLTLGDVNGIPILTPRAFYERIQRKSR